MAFRTSFPRIWFVKVGLFSNAIRRLEKGMFFPNKELKKGGLCVGGGGGVKLKFLSICLSFPPRDGTFSKKN